MGWKDYTWIGKDLEGSCRGLMEVISQHLPGSTGGKTSVRTGDQVEIRTGHPLPEYESRTYRCANLLSFNSRISLVSNVSGSTLNNRHYQNHWLCGIWPSSGILNTIEKTTFRVLETFASSGEEKETSTLLGPLERTNLNHCLKTETDAAPETLCFLESREFWRWCIALRIAGSLDCVHGILNDYKTQRFGRWICVRPQVKGRWHLLCWVT
jgi:hypothetical protein